MSFRHYLLGFDTDEELEVVAGGFVGEGVAADEPVLCVTSETTGSILRDAVGHRAMRGVRFIDSTDWHQWPAWSLAGCGAFATEHRAGGRMRIVTEGWWQGDSLLQRRDWHRADAASNVVFDDARLSMLCLHDLRLLAVDADVFEQARRTHPDLLGLDGARPSDDYSNPATFIAECDRDALPEPYRTVQRTITADTLADSRGAVHEMATALELPAARADDLAMAAHEMATNAVEHGGGLAEQRIWAEDHALICEIRDHGTGFGHAVAGYRRPAVTAERGRGLWMARQLCELVELRSSGEGTTVRLHLQL